VLYACVRQAFENSLSADILAGRQELLSGADEGDGHGGAGQRDRAKRSLRYALDDLPVRAPAWRAPARLDTRRVTVLLPQVGCVGPASSGPGFGSGPQPSGDLLNRVEVARGDVDNEVVSVVVRDRQPTPVDTVEGDDRG
jgi:hypothetical protein